MIFERNAIPVFIIILPKYHTIIDMYVISGTQIAINVNCCDVPLSG